MYHIDCSEGDLGKYVIMPGDPFRTDLIAKELENPKLIAHNREYKSWTGTLRGEKVSVVSTGIGPASAAIAIEEMIKIGCHTFIRVGTAGRVSVKAQNTNIKGAIAVGAIRDESLTQEYVPIGYPAIADVDVINALESAAKELDYNYIKGVSHCKESFYGQMEPERMPLAKDLKEKWSVWKRAHVVSAEMESSTIFVLSSIFEKRAGSILSFDDNIDETIKVAIKGVTNLINYDMKKDNE